MQIADSDLLLGSSDRKSEVGRKKDGRSDEKWNGLRVYPWERRQRQSETTNYSTGYEDKSQMERQLHSIWTAMALDTRMENLL